MLVVCALGWHGEVSSESVSMILLSLRSFRGNEQVLLEYVCLLLLKLDSVPRWKRLFRVA